MPFFNNNGIKIFYYIKGNGKPILFLHGYMGNHIKHWKHQLNDPLFKDYQLIALDIRGFGKSAKEDENAHLAIDLLSDIRKLLSSELKLFSKPVLVGYSIGATLAMLYTLLYTKEVRGLFTVSPVPFFPRKIHTWNGTSIKNNQTKLIKVIYELAWKAFKTINQRFQTIRVKRYSLSPPKILTRFQKLETPILLLYGKYDTVIPLFAYEYLQSYFPSQTKCISLPVDHGITHEHPEIFNTIMMKFLSKL